MRAVSLSLISLLFVSCSQKNSSKDALNTFKFNLPREISSVDPLLLRGTAKRFILFNIHRGLYFYNKKNELIPHGAAACEWSGSRMLTCKLSDKKWSDGSPINSKDYLNTYKLIKSQKEESSELLHNLKELELKNNSTLVFHLNNPEKDFIHRLADVQWSPRKKEKLYLKKTWGVYSGPYKVLEMSEAFVRLGNNEFYDDFLRPDVKAVFIDDPSAALNLYSVGKIDFLRYLETSNAPLYPKRFMAPFARLDGLFFSPKHIVDVNLRKALFHSLNFTELQKIFSSPSLPGCSSLPSFFFKKTRDCYEFDLERSKEFLSKVSKVPEFLKIYIPSTNSNEHQKLAQWLRESWKKHLGIIVEINQLESGVFYEKVRLKKLSVYRKAVSLSTLTCSEAMNLVHTQPEFSDFKLSKELDCDQFFKEIHKMYIRLPLGMPSFAHLHAKSYSGYYINMLGQFGLERLKSLK